MLTAIYDDNKECKLIVGNEISDKEYLAMRTSLYCPSCKTPVKRIIRDNDQHQFIAIADNIHNICTKEYSKNFFEPLNIDYFSKLKPDSIYKYLEVLCDELVRISQLPAYQIIRNRIKNIVKVKVSKNIYSETNNVVIEVADILNFLNKPRIKIFLVAEIKGAYVGDSYMYIDLEAGKVPISVHLNGDLFNTIRSYTEIITNDLNNKESKYVIALFVSEIRAKNKEGLNLIIPSNQFVKIVKAK